MLLSLIKFNVQVRRAFLDKSFTLSFCNSFNSFLFTISPEKVLCTFVSPLFFFPPEMSLESLSSVYISVILINFPLPFPFLSQLLAFTVPCCTVAVYGNWVSTEMCPSPHLILVPGTLFRFQSRTAVHDELWHKRRHLSQCV